MYFRLYCFTAKCNGLNEYYEPCDYNCPPQTCESLDKVYACPIREGDKCKGRCKCKIGFYRNKIEQCITKEQCRKYFTNTKFGIILDKNLGH